MTTLADRIDCLEITVRRERAKAYKQRLKASRPKPVALAEVVAPTAQDRDGEITRIADGLAIELAEIKLIEVDDRGEEVVEHATARRVQAPIERMASRGQVSQEQARMGRKLHEVYAFGVCGARSSEKSGTGTSKQFGLGDAQLGALLDYRKVMLWLTPRQRGVVLRVICWEVPVKRVAEQTRTPVPVIMELLRSGLDVVANYFD
jgi:hypothetical protein